MVFAYFRVRSQTWNSTIHQNGVVAFHLLAQAARVDGRRSQGQWRRLVQRWSFTHTRGVSEDGVWENDSPNCFFG